jgi:Domain of unknown function (DUF4153)
MVAADATAMMARSQPAPDLHTRCTVIPLYRKPAMADSARQEGNAMTDTETSEAPWAEQPDAPEDAAGWALRPLMIAVLGLVAGLVVHFLLGDADIWRFQPTPQTLAEVAFVTVTAGLIGFTIERRLWWASVAFSLACGVIAAAVVWWNGPIAGWSGGDGWRVACLFLAIAIAAPLFQAARDSEAPRFPYSSVHDHAWTNIVLWGACWAFVGITFALMLLLSQLFQLIKIDFLKDLLDKYWFCRALIGLAFGGALGLLREQTQVVRLLQRVVATVLAVLAPVLAVGLILFVLALPFTGLNALWDATSATTPILLSCVVGALILANAVIGDVPEHERTFPLLKFGAMGLALVVFPLSVIAAIAVGLRIGQYGFTPERLWALTFVVLATAYSLAYLVSLLRGRLHWAEKVRPANLNLAFAVCGVALLLATPLVSFNAISTRDQVARLESGKLSPDRFDWRALAFQFGQPGRDALKRLTGSTNATIRDQAVAASKADSQWLVPDGTAAKRVADLSTTLRILPQGTALPEDLRQLIAASYPCGEGSRCTLAFLPGGSEALLLQDECFTLPAPAPSPAPGAKEVRGFDPMGWCGTRDPGRYRLGSGKWIDTRPESPYLENPAREKTDAAYKGGKIEVRKVERRQVFLGDQPIGDAFE